MSAWRASLCATSVRSRPIATTSPRRRHPDRLDLDRHAFAERDRTRWPLVAALHAAHAIAQQPDSADHAGVRDPDGVTPAGAPTVERLTDPLHELARALAGFASACVCEIAGPGFEFGTVDRGPGT